MADIENIGVIIRESETVVIVENQTFVVPLITEESTPVFLQEGEQTTVVIESTEGLAVTIGEEAILVVEDALLDNTIIEQVGTEATLVSISDPEVISVVLADVFVGQSGSSSLPKVAVLVPQGATVVINSVQTAQIEGVKWVVVLTDTSLLREAFEILASYSGISARHSVYAKIGDRLPHQVDVDLSGSNLELSVTNNHTEDVTASVLRMAV